MGTTARRVRTLRAEGELIGGETPETPPDCGGWCRTHP